MLLRLRIQYGDNGTVTGLIAMNDTRSDILTLFYLDLRRLDMEGYLG